jgi:hypothetical protein
VWRRHIEGMLDVMLAGVPEKCIRGREFVKRLFEDERMGLTFAGHDTITCCCTAVALVGVLSSWLARSSPWNLQALCYSTVLSL